METVMMSIPSAVLKEKFSSNIVIPIITAVIGSNTPKMAVITEPILVTALMSKPLEKIVVNTADPIKKNREWKEGGKICPLNHMAMPLIIAAKQNKYKENKSWVIFLVGSAVNNIM